MKLHLSVPKPTGTRIAVAGILVFLFGMEASRPAPQYGSVPLFENGVKMLPNRVACGPRVLHPAIYGVACADGQHVSHAWHLDGTVIRFNTKPEYMPEMIAPVFGWQSDEVCRGGECARISHEKTDSRDRAMFEVWRHHLRP